MMPTAMSFFDLLQFAALLIRENASHLPVRFRDDFVDAPAGVASHLMKFRRRFIQNRRNFGHLFRRQIELSLQSFAHSLADDRGPRRREEKVPCVRCAHERACHAAGEKDEEEPGG
jgi:hypothetical protein